MMQISFLDLGLLNDSIRDQLDSAYQRVMESGWFVMGPELESFESEFAEYCNVRHCIGVGNGLEALHLLLKAYEIGPGDEVIVPANTFIATWLAVSECGATPIPVEPDISTHNLNPRLLEASITTKTKGIIPVHLYGQPADMDPINELAAKYGLVVIEDAAQAQGARYKGKRTGSLSHAAATSFYPGKNLGALGDGGAVLTSDDVIADKVKELRNYGSKIKYQHKLTGYNSRLDELQAAFLRVKLKALDKWNAKRSKIASLYSSNLQSCSINLPFVSDDSEHVWHLYVIRSRSRNQLKAYLDEQGISSGIHYPIPPHQQACYAAYGSYSLPISELLAREVISLPMSPELREEEINQVCIALRAFEGL